MGFEVYLLPDDPISGWQWGDVAPELTLTRKWHRSSTKGGPVGAEVEIHGPSNSLWEILEWLRRPMEIFNPNQQLVWWGFVNEVRLNWGRMTIGLSLDEMANTVTITYSYTAVTGAAVRGTTVALQDAASAARYGIKELYESLGEADAAMAAARQTGLLADRANPPKVPSFGGGGADGQPSGLLVAVGWFETLGWRRFNRLEGRIEFDGEEFEGANAQAIGWGITASNRIGFAAGSIHDLDARLKALGEGARVAVSGSGLNNNVYTVTASTNDDPKTYSNNTISFDPVDDIEDRPNKGLGFVRTDNFLQVQGSLWNDGYHFIKQAGDDHLATMSSFTGLVFLEAAGNSITLTQGHRVEVTGATITNEEPGASVTLRVYGYELAQGFVASHSMTVDKLGLKVGKIGVPTDSFEFGIWSDVGSQPFALLASTSVVGSLLEDKPTWTWFDVSNVASLTMAARYWLFARRTGVLDPLNYYTVEMVKGTYDLCKVWTGAAWVDHPGGYAMPFKVWGAEDTALQIQRILSDKGQFFSAIDMQVTQTGVQTNQWRSNDLTAYDEVMKLLETRTSTGARLLANVTPERSVQIYVEPVDTGDGDYYNPLDGSIRLAMGGRRPSGLLPTGEWLIVEGVPDGSMSGISPLFVDDSECGEDGDVYEITPK